MLLPCSLNLWAKYGPQYTVVMEYCRLISAVPSVGKYVQPYLPPAWTHEPDLYCLILRLDALIPRLLVVFRQDFYTTTPALVGQSTVVVARLPPKGYSVKKAK